MASKWYYRIGDEKHGPVESEALKLLAEVGQITPNTLVQKEGAKSWAEASRVNGLFKASTNDTVNLPPILNESASQKPPVIPVATEFAHKVQPAMPVPVAVGTPDPPPMVAPAVVPSAEGGESHKEFLEHKRRRRSSMPLLFTVIGIFFVTGVGSMLYIYKPDSPAERPKNPSASDSYTSTTPLVTEEPAGSSPEQKVFLGIRSFSDASRSRMRLANGQIQIRIIEVWLTKSERTVDGKILPPEYTMNVQLETENLNAADEFILNRESPVLASGNNLSPYAALAQNGTDEFLSLKQKLNTQTIPPGGKIEETLSFALNSDQLQQFKLAIPLAWFRQTGYTGYSIPDVMIAAAPPVTSVAQTPETGVAQNRDSIEQVPGNAILGQVAPSQDKPDANPQKDTNSGKLPPPPDFGIPDKPAVENGDQPDDIKSLQESIKASVKPDKPKQDASQEEEPSEPAIPAKPVFK